MSSHKWTDEQSAAINTRDCSLLVSAAAGAGKTAVLVERIIRRICDEQQPIDVDRLLVVTFTKAAAAEMRERISSAISRELNSKPESRHLYRQLSLLNRASITTLHSFCLDILRKYFYIIGLDPNFRVADDAEAALLRVEVMEELFEDYYTAESQEFLGLVDAFGGDRDDLSLQDMVLRLFEFASANPWPRIWLEALADQYNLPVEGSYNHHLYFLTVLEGVDLSLRGCRSKLERARGLTEKPGGPLPYRDNINSDLQVIEDLINARSSSWMNIFQAINTVEFGRLKPCRDNDVDERLKARVKKTRDDVKKTVKKIREDYFLRGPADLADDLKKSASMVRSLAEITINFRERYLRAKAAKSLVDFADLEHYCLQILTDPSSEPGNSIPSKVAAELKDYYCEVLVDEFQDINGVQETILQLVSREEPDFANRFMVGDAKQSIYRFRLADPSLFLQKYHNYPRVEGASQRCIDLTSNFRSRREVVDAVNHVFREVMTSETGEIHYDLKAELVSAFAYPEPPDGQATAAGPAELHLLEADLSSGPDREVNHQEGFEDTPDNGTEGEPIELDTIQREAGAVARRIKRMVMGSSDKPGPEFEVFDHRAGSYRPVQLKDIVVLLRTTRVTSNTFLEELGKLGISAYADLGTGYFETVEIETILSLLHIIDNPRQDIPLAAVLRSPIVGFRAEELALIRVHRQGDFFSSASALADESGLLSDKIRHFLSKLDEWRRMARRMPLAELIWHLYNDTGYYAYAGGMPRGDERQANLRSLYERARQFERTSFSGLFNFLRFIGRFRDLGSDLGSASTVGENEDAVRIMSIHKSKGLEFPVVIVAGLGKTFNMTDLTKTAIIHRELGIGLPVVDLDLRLTYPTIAQAAIKKRLKAELLAEEMRVLYVAMTRAREKIILFGSTRKLVKSADEWCERAGGPAGPLADTAIMAAKCFLDWICPAVARHPDGHALRKLAGDDQWEMNPAGGYWPGYSSRWTIFSYYADGNEGNITGLAGVEDRPFLEAVRRFEPVAKSEGYLAEITALLDWRYPWANSVGIPVKATVTEIKSRFKDPDDSDFVLLPQPGPQASFSRNIKRPRFLSRFSPLGPAERGSAMHLVMQHIQYFQELSAEDVDNQVRLMLEKELLTEEQAVAIDSSAVAVFFSTPLGRRFQKALTVKKEVAFTMAIPAHHLYGEITESDGERVLIQGIIDCLIDEGDGYIIVDYKTDQAASWQVDELIARYRGQLNLYSLAVESILGKRVKEKYLYLFSLGREVNCG